MQVAESKGLPKLKYHLLPRTKGFWVTVQSLRGTGEYPSSIECSNIATGRFQILWAGCVRVCERESLEAFANQMSLTANCCYVASLVQLRLCTIPHWTSETTRRRPCSEFLMGGNITPTYMWGTKNCFAVRIATFHFRCNRSLSERSDFPSHLQENPSRVDPRRGGRVCCLAPQTLPGKG